MYPADVRLGFGLDRYIALCRKWKGRADRAFAHHAAPDSVGVAGSVNARTTMPYATSPRRLWGIHLSSGSMPRSTTAELLTKPTVRDFLIS
jgi:hypothetical protein